MGESRNVYIEPDERAVIRTADVYQTEVEAGTAGYSDTLLAVVANFKNNGAPEGFNAQCMVGKSKRGEVALKLFAVIDPDTKTFVKAGFKSRGCLAMTACASVVCSMVEGKTFPEALAIKPEDVRDALDGVPWDKTHTMYFASEGIRALIGDFMINHGASIKELDAVVPCDDLSIPCAMCEHCSLRDARVELQFGSSSRNDEPDHDAAESKSNANESSAPLQAPTAAGLAAGATATESADAGEDGGASESSESDAQSLAENNALALVFDDVRAQSANSKLVQPSRWEELGLVPEHMTAEEFEMFVYEYVEQEKAIRAEAALSASAPVFRTASRTVGVPQLFSNASAGEDEAVGSDANAVGIEAVGGDAATEANAEANDDSVGASSALEEAPEEADEEVGVANSNEVEDGPFAGLKIPAGYKLVELEGEYTLVPDENAEPVKLIIDCENIVALTGAYGYYLYDHSIMTDTYAHWAFLAAEDNRVITFSDCVREDSRVYPRPFAASSLKNPPFNMNDEEIAQTWSIIEESGEFPDLRQTVASNGDVYYYSTEYLSPVYADSLVEWDAVERKMYL